MSHKTPITNQVANIHEGSEKSFKANNAMRQLLSDAYNSSFISGEEKKKLGFALSMYAKNGLIYQSEVLVAHAVLIREASSRGSLPSTTKKVSSVAKKVVKKKVSKKKVEKDYSNVKPGTIRVFKDGKKKFIGPHTKADGTKVKGYWMKVRSK